MGRRGLGRCLNEDGTIDDDLQQPVDTLFSSFVLFPSFSTFDNLLLSLLIDQKNRWPHLHILPGLDYELGKIPPLYI